MNQLRFVLNSVELICSDGDILKLERDARRGCVFVQIWKTVGVIREWPASLLRDNEEARLHAASRVMHELGAISDETTQQQIAALLAALSA